MTTVGIRDLRQHASEYLRRVRDGETITITDRGEPVAELRPVSRVADLRPAPDAESAFDRMIAEGRVRLATGSLKEFLELRPPVTLEPGEPTLTEVLLQMREDERA